MVKMHKALFYSDMIFYALRGESITGAEYRKRDHGPTCDMALSAIRQLSDAGELEVKRVDYFGYWKRAFALRTSAETNELSGDEKALIGDCVSFVCKNSTAKAISEFSHSGPWELVGFGEVIPYYAAISLIPDEVSEETLAWGSDVGDQIEAEGQDRDAVALEDYRAFRSRLLEAQHRG